MKVRPAALISHNDAILVMRYRYGDTDVFMLPGGNQDAGESLADTLVRELEEELGVTVKPEAMVISCEVISWPKKEDTLHCIFRTAISSGTPQLNPEHTSALEVLWLPVADISQKHMYPHIGAYIPSILNGTYPPTHVGPIVQPYA